MKIVVVKRIIFLLVFLLGYSAVNAADDLITKQIIIKLDKAGTLPDKIGSTKKNKITNLKIVGDVNGTDWGFIREMLGMDNFQSVGKGNLSVLDLSETKIVEGGIGYINSNSYPYAYYTKDNSLGTFAFVGCSGLTSLELPSGITSIEEEAFEGCSGLTSLALPSGVTSIDDDVFQGCSGLTSLAIPSGVTSIGYNAFSCSGLSSISVNWETPPSIDSSVFYEVDKQKCTLYVPKGTFQDYWLADVWGDFENIVEYDVTGVDNVTTSTDAKEISRYSVNGQRLSAPTKGLNIVKYSDGSVKKVAVQ